MNKEKTIERGQAVRQTKGKSGVIYEANVTKISFPHNLFLDLALSSLTLKRQYDNGQYIYNYVQLRNCVISYNCKPKNSCIFVRTRLSSH